MLICCLNNYPLDKMARLASTGAVPAQHCWGVDALLEDGVDVTFAPFHERDDDNVLDSISRRSRYVLGQIDQELYGLRRRVQTALYFSADGRSLRGLALLPRKARGDARLVSIIHHPPGRLPLEGRALRRQDRLGCLSEPLAAEVSHLTKRQNVIPMSWGPDLASPLYGASGDAGRVVSAGKSNRDIPTLLSALRETDLPALIYDNHGQIQQTNGLSRITIMRPGGEGTDPVTKTGFLYQPVVRELAQAAIVAIPVADSERLAGLTELNDALALGKPVIVTRSRYMPVNVEQIGCGFVIDPGDVAGWVHALRSLQDIDVRREMGQRGRRFAETSWNYEIFKSQLRTMVAD